MGLRPGSSELYRCIGEARDGIGTYRSDRGQSFRAEVQTTTESGEMTQRFIEFVMMQAQNAALFLGQIPNPQTGKGEINLDVAKMFIDQLVMIRAKTRGNLVDDETKVLNNAISNLQMVF